MANVLKAGLNLVGSFNPVAKIAMQVADAAIDHAMDAADPQPEGRHPTPFG